MGEPLKLRWQPFGEKGGFPDLGGGRIANSKIEVVRALRVGGRAWRKNSKKNREFLKVFDPVSFGL